MVPSLTLLSCESPVSVKENPDRKKKKKDLPFYIYFDVNRIYNLDLINWILVDNISRFGMTMAFSGCPTLSCICKTSFFLWLSDFHKFYYQLSVFWLMLLNLGLLNLSCLLEVAWLYWVLAPGIKILDFRFKVVKNGRLALT